MSPGMWFCKLKQSGDFCLRMYHSIERMAGSCIPVGYINIEHGHLHHLLTQPGDTSLLPSCRPGPLISLECTYFIRPVYLWKRAFSHPPLWSSRLSLLTTVCDSINSDSYPWPLLLQWQRAMSETSSHLRGAGVMNSFWRHELNVNVMQKWVSQLFCFWRSWIIPFAPSVHLWVGDWIKPMWKNQSFSSWLQKYPVSQSGHSSTLDMHYTFAPAPTLHLSLLCLKHTAFYHVTKILRWVPAYCGILECTVSYAQWRRREFDVGRIST